MQRDSAVRKVLSMVVLLGVVFSFCHAWAVPVVTVNPPQGKVPLDVVCRCDELSPPSAIIGYDWDFGDGSAPILGGLYMVPHSYTTPGYYEVKCTVNYASHPPKMDSFFVTVFKDGASLIRQLTANPQAGPAPLSVAFRCDTFIPADIMTYSWDFGDNSTINLGSPLESHSYTANGLYVAKCTVTDNLGNVDEEQIIIRVGEEDASVDGDWHVFGAELKASGALEKMYSGFWTVNIYGNLVNSHLNFVCPVEPRKTVNGNVYLDIDKNLAGYFKTSAPGEVKIVSGTVCSDNQVAQLSGQFLTGTTMTHMEQVFWVRDGGVFTQGDLTGTWHYFLWQPGTPGTDAGFVQFDNIGLVVASGPRWFPPMGPLAMSPLGTLSGALGGETLVSAKMSRNKDVMVWLLDSCSLCILFKAGPVSFSQAELVLPWYISKVRVSGGKNIPEYGILEPDYPYSPPADARFKAVDGLTNGQWPTGLTSLLVNGIIAGYLVDPAGAQTDIMYGQMGFGRRMAGLWTKEPVSGDRGIIILMDPPQGWKPPDLTVSNSTDPGPGGGGGGGGCVMNSGSSHWETWLLLGIVWLVIRLAMVRRRA